MIYRNSQDAPRDGTTFLVFEENEDGMAFLSSVRWLDVEGNPKWSLFVYVDELLRDICPGGPEAFFLWTPMPDGWVP